MENMTKKERTKKANAIKRILVQKIKEGEKIFRFDPAKIDKRKKVYGSSWVIYIAGNKDVAIFKTGETTWGPGGDSTFFALHVMDWKNNKVATLSHCTAICGDSGIYFYSLKERYKGIEIIYRNRSDNCYRRDDYIIQDVVARHDDGPKVVDHKELELESGIYHHGR